MWNSGSRPSYSAIRTKLGELMVAATPRPAPKPFANCVLPAPRSPRRAIRSPGLAAAARAAPRARVASASVVVSVRSRVETTMGAEGTRGSAEAFEIGKRERGRRPIVEADEPGLETDAAAERAHAGRPRPAALAPAPRSLAYPDQVSGNPRQAHARWLEEELR